MQKVYILELASTHNTMIDQLHLLLQVPQVMGYGKLDLIMGKILYREKMERLEWRNNYIFKNKLSYLMKQKQDIVFYIKLPLQQLILKEEKINVNMKCIIFNV